MQIVFKLSVHDQYVGIISAVGFVKRWVAESTDFPAMFIDSGVLANAVRAPRPFPGRVGILSSRIVVTAISGGA
jgi:hypothetical protein